MTKVFEESLSLFKDKISDCIKSNKSISITTHNDCDGLTSGSIITKALIREGAKCTIRTSKEFSKNVVQSFKTDSRDFHIITDLGGGFGNELNQTIDKISENHSDNQNPSYQIIAQMENSQHVTAIDLKITIGDEGHKKYH